MVHLLDINVLIALCDPLHEHHGRALAWFLGNPRPAWATCAITENGFVRILGHKKYPNFDGGTAAAREVLQGLCILPGHQFWPCDLSLLGESVLLRAPDSRQITDTYLLALAVHHRGRMATLDRGIDVSLVKGGRQALCLIP